MITVIGSGLVGSLLSLLLKQKGFEVEVFEKRPDPRLAANAAGRSINLVVTSRGLYALELAGLSKEVRALAVPVFGRMIHSVSGDTTYQAYGKSDEYNLSISRDTLNRFLIDKAEAAGVNFHFAHEIDSLDFKESDVVFAADGAGSKVRKNLAASGKLSEQTEWLEADYKELTLPLSDGSRQNFSTGSPQLKTDALHIWPRGDHMMMALANKDGSFTVTLYLPKKSFEGLKSKDSVEQLFERQFKDAIELMPNYINEFLNHPQGSLGTVRCDKWVVGNVALIGDAAHAIVPFFGQGMNSGFEDCSQLLSLIEEQILISATTGLDSSAWEEILTRYELSRKENANAIADMALENWVEMRDKVADQKFLLRKKVESLLEERHPQYKSRYGLITYTLVPYKLAQDAGRLQDEMFMELLADKTSVDEIDWNLADRLIESCWHPFLTRHQLKIENYQGT